MPVHVEGFNGGDRTTIELPAVQREMLEAVAGTGKPLVVVLMNGSALATPWIKQHANAILEAWYPGEEAGNAIAQVLTGEINPGGRLPVTFYAKTGDLPAFDDYSMKQRTYRYFRGQPLWGFGYGLTYSKFKWSTLKLSSSSVEAGSELTVDADVENLSNRAGDAVSELYLTPPASSSAPQLELVGFERKTVMPHARQHLHFVLQPRTLSTVDVEGRRAVRPGGYTLWLGGTQPKESDGQSVSASFKINGTRDLPK